MRAEQLQLVSCCWSVTMCTSMPAAPHATRTAAAVAAAKRLDTMSTRILVLLYIIAKCERLAAVVYAGTWLAAWE